MNEATKAIAETIAARRERIAELEAENAKLRQLVETYGRHSQGCSGEFGDEHRCRCGWREESKALADTEGGA